MVYFWARKQISLFAVQFLRAKSYSVAGFPAASVLDSFPEWSPFVHAWIRGGDNCLGKSTEFDSRIRIPPEARFL